MDLPVIGAHCALPTCNELDLLPIRCHCHSLYCRQHFLPEAHACTAVQAKESSRWSKRAKCALEGCEKLSLESVIGDHADGAGRTPATCSQCSFSFCASHRHPDSHSCPGPASPPLVKNEAARALLAKNFPASATAKTTQSSQASSSRLIKPTTTNPAKLAQMKKIELMKMRQRAIPGDPKTKATPSSVLSDRLHVSVKAEEADGAGKTFWFNKTIGTGKALDCSAIHLGVTSSDTQPLQLAKLHNGDSNEKTMLRNDQPLSEQVEEGDHLLIVRLSGTI